MSCTVPLVAGACPSGSEAWVSVPDALPFEDLGIDAAGIAYVYAWGVGAVLSLWALGYGVRAALEVIRRA